MPSRIEDYAIIGDGHSAALVALDGSIDWLCWPRFDSGACFAALLGTPEHGRWQIRPAHPYTVSRRYREDTLILETEFKTATGSVVITDFMPQRNGWPELIRLVTGRTGTVEMEMELVLRFDYGYSIPWVSQLDDNSGLRAIAGPDMVVVRADADLRGENMKTVADFTVTEGQTARFVISYSASHRPPPPATDPMSALAVTETYWRDWAARCNVKGEYATQVRRSLMTLKALAYEPTGGIVAAPTTSLPEQLGGTRNWDYRYCWLRDTTITLLALMRAGYYEEARAWRAWLGRVVAGAPTQLQIMYGIAGERRLPEWEVTWLPGYEGAAPVRVGNQAADQLQLDVYGEVMSALHVARIGDVEADDAAWAIERAMCDHVMTIWCEPDEGIWEVRGGRQHFTFSKVMAWVALDRAVKSAERFSLSCPIDDWRRVRDEIHADVCKHGYNEKRKSFVQIYGGDALDASLLLVAPVGFLPADDERVINTVDTIARELTEGGLVKRYHTAETADGLPPGEGTFLACSFWLVDNYILRGEHERAVEIFERLLTLCNDVGLLAEEYDVAAQRQVGNFPQSFSHVSLVNTALNLMQHNTRMIRTAS